MCGLSQSDLVRTEDYSQVSISMLDRGAVVRGEGGVVAELHVALGAVQRVRAVRRARALLHLL